MEIAIYGKYAPPALPHHALRNLARKYGPLIHLQLGEIHAVVVSSPRMAKQVLKIHELSFAGRPKLIASNIVFYNQKDIVFAKYGDYWKRKRKICISELFSAKMVKSFNLIRQDEVHNVVTSIGSMPNAVVNMTEKALQLNSSVICRLAFGKVWYDRDNLLMIVREVLFLLGRFDVEDFFPWTLLHEISGMRNRLMNIHHKHDVILENIINEHEENQANGEKGNSVFGGENLIDLLLRVMKNDELQFPITNENIKAIILDMFLGGTETTSTTIQWALSELMMYLKLVKETLRLNPPGPLLASRECMKETTIDGYTIPLKTKVIANSCAIGRDFESWNDPGNFVPEIFEDNYVDFKGNHYQFIPFGAGSRICPGMQYSLADVMYPIAQLLYHVDWKLPYGIQPKALDMTETFGITATRQNHLHLIAIPYDSSHY